jgi:hypothetical protein
MLKKKKPEYNLLELTPERAKDFEEKDGLVIILIPKFKTEFFRKLIPKSKPKDIRINFDKLGTAVWKSIDGKKKVSNIITELSNAYGEKIQPAAERIAKFLKEIYKHKFINFKEIKR